MQGGVVAAIPAVRKTRKQIQVMKVGELIKRLEKLPQDARVMVDGYEGGLCELRAPSITVHKCRLNVNKKDWNGPHAIDATGKALAVVLSRN